ncbi:hypothetical protein HK096_003570, partial [Nowakowskiella sp. JEL0078]
MESTDNDTPPPIPARASDTIADWKLALRTNREQVVQEKLSESPTISHPFVVPTDSGSRIITTPRNAQSQESWTEHPDSEAYQWLRDQEALGHIPKNSSSPVLPPAPHQPIVSDETKRRLKDGAFKVLGSAKNWIGNIGAKIPVQYQYSDSPSLPPRNVPTSYYHNVDEDGWQKFDPDVLKAAATQEQEIIRDEDGRRVRFVEQESESEPEDGFVNLNNIEITSELLEEDRRARAAFEEQLREEKEIQAAIKAVEEAERINSK